MKTIGVIPARFESKRFPGKALALLEEKPILQYVYEQALKSNVLDRVIIATDDTRIRDTARKFNAPVVMTSKDCASGSDRVAEVVKSLDCEVVVNIQADQPMLPPEILEEVVKPLTRSDIDVSTPIYPLVDLGDLDNPNIVKVVVDKDGFAIYFSRAPIPYRKNEPKGVYHFYKHIGIYAYRKKFLLEYVNLQPSPLEEIEGLEQLRILEYGYRIKTVLVTHDSISVDTKEDLVKLKARG